MPQSHGLKNTDCSSLSKLYAITLLRRLASAGISQNYLQINWLIVFRSKQLAMLPKIHSSDKGISTGKFARAWGISTTLDRWRIENSYKIANARLAAKRPQKNYVKMPTAKTDIWREAGHLSFHFTSPRRTSGNAHADTWREAG